MNSYPHASTSVHIDSAPEAKRLVNHEGRAFISVTAEASVSSDLYLEKYGGPQVRTRLDGSVALYLTPDQAVTLASQLMRAVGRPRIEVVA